MVTPRQPPAGPSDAPAAPAARSPEAQCNCHAGPPDLCPHHGPLIRKALAEGNYFDVVFDGPPEHEAGRFVECEDSAGRGVNIGRWFDRGDGTWGLRILIPSLAGAAELAAESRGAKAARDEIDDAVTKLEAPRNGPQYGEIHDVIEAARRGLLAEYLASQDGDLARIIAEHV